MFIYMSIYVQICSYMSTYAPWMFLASYFINPYIACIFISVICYCINPYIACMFFNVIFYSRASPPAAGPLVAGGEGLRRFGDLRKMTTLDLLSMLSI